jgi:hypothetical protein
MKTKLTALALSACLLGAATAAPKDKKAEPPKKKTEQAPAKKAVKKATDKKKSDDTKKTRKTAPAKKAVADASRKKATASKMAKNSLARLKELSGKKKAADSDRNNAANALKAAEKKVAMIGSEMKKISAQLKAKADSDRKTVEHAKAEKIRKIEAQERSLVGTMKKELQNLKQMVDRLNTQLAKKKDCSQAGPDEAKNKDAKKK